MQCDGYTTFNYYLSIFCSTIVIEGNSLGSPANIKEPDKEDNTLKVLEPAHPLFYAH